MNVTPLGAALGAEIASVDLSRPMSDSLAEAIGDAFHEHQVLVARGQSLPPEAQVRFTEAFGAVDPHPLNPRRHLEEQPGVMVLENRPGTPGPRNDFWHSDLSHMEHPPAITCLHAITVPEARGDTMYCNTYLGYESLSERLREVLEGLRAVHSGEATRRRNNEEGQGLRINDVPPPCVHPVVRTHPATGRKSLYVNPFFTTHFEDMSPEESAGLLSFLYSNATRPEFIYRHRWAPGDVVLWDNRCTMHYAVKDYDESMPRYMHRTTAAGDRPK